MRGERSEAPTIEQLEARLFFTQLSLVVQLGDRSVDRGVRRILAGDQRKRGRAMLEIARAIALQGQFQQGSVELRMVAGRERLLLITQPRYVAFLKIRIALGVGLLPFGSQSDFEPQTKPRLMPN